MFVGKELMHGDAKLTTGFSRQAKPTGRVLKRAEQGGMRAVGAGHRHTAGSRVLVGEWRSTRDKKIATYNLLTKDGGHEKRAYYYAV